MFKIFKVLVVIVFVYLVFASIASAAASPIKAFGGRIIKVEKLNQDGDEYKCKNNDGSIVSVRSRFGITPYFIPSNVRPVTRNELKADRFILGNHRIESVVIECYKKEKKEEEKIVPDKVYIVPPIVYYGLSNR